MYKILNLGSSQWLTILSEAAGRGATLGCEGLAAGLGAGDRGEGWFHALHLRLRWVCWQVHLTSHSPFKDSPGDR